MFLSDHDAEQVIASLLIILRVADKRALTSDTIVTGHISSLHFTGQAKSTVGNGTSSNGDPMTSAVTIEEAPIEPNDGIETTGDKFS